MGPCQLGHGAHHPARGANLVLPRKAVLRGHGLASSAAVPLGALPAAPVPTTQREGLASFCKGRPFCAATALPGRAGLGRGTPWPCPPLGRAHAARGRDAWPLAALLASHALAGRAPAMSAPLAFGMSRASHAGTACLACLGRSRTSHARTACQRAGALEGLRPLRALASRTSHAALLASHASAARAPAMPAPLASVRAP